MDSRWEFVPGTKDDEVNLNFVKDKTALYKETEKVEDFVGRSGDFEAVVVPGGYGRMFYRPNCVRD